MQITALIPAKLSRRTIFFFLTTAGVWLAGAGATSHAQTLDIIGLTVLRATTTNLDGSGIPVLQVEAESSQAPAANWEVNPAAVGLSASNFVYYSTNGSANSY